MTCPSGYLATLHTPVNLGKGREAPVGDRQKIAESGLKESYAVFARSPREADDEAISRFAIASLQCSVNSPLPLRGKVGMGVIPLT